jgi:DNA-directed RNA polymerase specialized sigma24 family protein
VREAMHNLAEPERELLQLTSWERLSAAEIARVMWIPAATVRTRLHRARNRTSSASTTA